MMNSHELTQIKVKQLFYQMKEYFPDVPDSVVRLCLKQACFEKEKTFSLLRIEAEKYSGVLTSKNMPHVLPRFQHSTSFPSSPSVKTNLAQLAPVVRQLSDNSHYSPSFDLSLPLKNNFTHQLPDKGQVKLVYEQLKSTTSVNVIVNSPTDKSPRITCTQVANGFPPQVQITIHPQGIPKTDIAYPPQEQGNEPLQARIQAQCEKRELLRRQLQESRQEVTLLSKKVDELQKELAHQQKEETDSFSPTPAYYDFKMLKQEIRDLESECQSLIRELEPSAMVKRNTVVYNPDNKEWSCSYCTFLNHPELSVCEQCERPKCRRIIDVEGQVEVGAAVIPFTRPGNIRIQVRHRPRTAQGWIL